MKNLILKTVADALEAVVDDEVTDEIIQSIYNILRRAQEEPDEEPQKQPECCGNCKFFAASGVCRRHPPPYPEVGDHMWCGEWRLVQAGDL